MPSLRTGEGLVLGDALQVPSRIRVQKAPDRPIGDDPKLPEAWLSDRPDPEGYSAVVASWRSQSTAKETAGAHGNDSKTKKRVASGGGQTATPNGPEGAQ